MKYIKLILTILIINFGLTLNAQNDSLTGKNFENKTFKTNQIIGVKDFNYNPVILAQNYINQMMFMEI